ncbi:MAG: VacJ family lipoprotein [Nitrospirota bacterium]|jgi:phospholipid-binding lipoprotein MlaA
MPLVRRALSLPAAVLILLTAGACAHGGGAHGTASTGASNEILLAQVGPMGGGMVSPREEAPPSEEELWMPDPIEPWNRAMFTFNDRFYFWALKPAARGYKTVTPTWVRLRIRNFFRNIEEPVNIVNSALQAKFKRAGVHLARFLFNSTAGVAGLFDVAGAEKPGLKAPEEDLGQTLGVYGLGNGFYIVWPFLGPSSARDIVGWTGDLFLDPTTYAAAPLVVIGVEAGSELNDTTFVLGEYESLKEAALDPYVAVRNAYFQYRLKQVRQ